MGEDTQRQEKQAEESGEGKQEEGNMVSIESSRNQNLR